MRSALRQCAAGGVLGSFSRQRRRRYWMAAGVFAGSVSNAGSFVITNASVSDTSSPCKYRVASQHLEQHHAERPDVRSPVHRFAPACSGDI